MMYNETYTGISDTSAHLGYDINNKITPEIIQRIATNMHLHPAFTITKVEEFNPAAIETHMCETDNSISENWTWIDRVFRVSYVMHDWVNKGESMESDQIMALPKQHMVEIITHIDDREHKPLSVYTIHESETL